jgi:hypothetical protein
MKNALILVLLIIFPINCGGGGGKYYPPKVAVNIIGVVKENASETNIDNNSKLIADISLDEIDQKIDNEKKISGIKYSAVTQCKFLDNYYFLAIPYDNFVNIISTQGKVEKGLDTPRYPTKISAIELIGVKNTKYLAVYIQQQASSHSSTLYILDKKFDVVYKEHLLGALWIARESSELGHNLIVAAETKWNPKGKWISVGGPWRYILFRNNT